MRKALKIITSICIFFLLLPFSTFAQNNTSTIPKEVITTAQEGLNSLKSRIDYKNFGYSSPEALNSAYIGDGFSVYNVDSNKLLQSNTENDDFLSLKTSSNEWIFLVMLDNKAVSLLRVAKQEGQYAVVYFGGNSSELHSALQNFKKTLTEKGNKNPNTKLVSIGWDEFFLVEKAKGKEYILSSKNPDEYNKSFNNTTLRTSNEVLTPLKQIVKENREKQLRGEDPKFGGSTSSSLSEKYNEIASNNSSTTNINFTLLSSILLAVLLLVLLLKRTPALK